MDNAALPVFFHLSCYGMHVKFVYRICFSQIICHSLSPSFSHAHALTHSHTHTHTHSHTHTHTHTHSHTHTHRPLSTVVIIMIAAVAHYASKRCGSYTVNPDPEKKSNGAPSWISVSVQSPSVAPAATNHHANGHSNGHSYQTKSFRASSPTCSTHSFT